MDKPKSATIVTGGGRGIGRAIAKRMARECGAILVGRTEEDLRSAVAEIETGGSEATYVVGDVRDTAVAAQAVAAAEKRGWEVRNLVCNAGIGKGGPTETFDPELWKTIMDVNVNGAFNFVRACLPGMLKRGRGNIVLMSSMAGLKGNSRIAAYNASKHALVGFARSLAVEHGKRGIVAVPICPGFVAGEMTDRTIHGMAERRGLTEEEARDRVARQNPQHRIMPPEEVAEAVAFVCSGLVPSLSGSPLVLGGGE